MRVLSLRVGHWRNFRNVSVDVAADSPLVCLVGENGTGKSSLLELLAAAAQHLGISHGFDVARGNPFSEPHRFEVALQLSDSVVAELVSGAPEAVRPMCNQWNGVLELTSESPGPGPRVHGGGLESANEALQLAQHVVQELRQSPDIHYLFLDADRAYPPFQLHPQHYAEALGQDLGSYGVMRQYAFRPTRTLYEEWIKYALAGEGRAARAFYAQARTASEDGAPQPPFSDWFEGYKRSLQDVLPHLRFHGTSEEQRTLLFDSAGSPLRFWQLSGGEREIAFIVGQIERFRLRRGLLLLDEPELHLNPDLVRTWVAYLRDTIEDGQVWIATHALEAAEVTGPESTFVLQRGAGSRIVEAATPLRSRPVLRVLSASLGSPGFSITRLRFVLVEGERLSRERERFHALTEHQTANRFIEAGNCREVVRKLVTLRDLSAESGEQINIGGIIDRDFRTAEQISALRDIAPVYVLPCHEVENFFLHPTGLEHLIRRAGYGLDPLSLLQQEADRFTGRWILDRTHTRLSLPAPPKAARVAAAGLTLAQIDADPDRSLEAIVAAANSDLWDAEKLSALRVGLAESLMAYRQARVSGDFWAQCFGKEMLGGVANQLGFRSADALERNVHQLWASGELAAPPEVNEVCRYVEAVEAFNQH